MRHLRRSSRSSIFWSISSLFLAAFASACSADAPADADAGADAGAALSPASLLAPAGVAITVRDADGPIKGALIVLRAPVAEGEFAPGVLWQALTDDEGVIHAVLPLRPDQKEIDVVIQQPGWDGPWSDEAKRKDAGDFAPSWQRVSVAQLGALSVALTRRQP
jgi:hypothetical protein